MLEIGQVQPYQAASDEEAPRMEVAPNVAAQPILYGVYPRRMTLKTGPAVCWIVVTLVIVGLVVYGGSILVTPRYVVCDAPTTLWLACRHRPIPHAMAHSTRN
jgi:hypothetical protein